MQAFEKNFKTSQPAVKIDDTFVERTMVGINEKKKAKKRYIFFFTIFVLICLINFKLISFEYYTFLFFFSLVFIISETLLSQLRIKGTMKKSLYSFSKVLSFASIIGCSILFLKTSNSIAQETILSQAEITELRQKIQVRINNYLFDGEKKSTIDEAYIYEGISKEELRALEFDTQTKKEQYQRIADDQLENHIITVKDFRSNQNLKLETGPVSTSPNVATTVRIFTDDLYIYYVDIFKNKVVEFSYKIQTSPLPSENVSTSIPLTQLQQLAIDLIKKETPNLDLDSLEYKPGSKTGNHTNYFFRWQSANNPNEEFKFVQVGLRSDGVLVNYVNTFASE